MNCLIIDFAKEQITVVFPGEEVSWSIKNRSMEEILAEISVLMKIYEVGSMSEFIASLAGEEEA